MTVAGFWSFCGCAVQEVVAGRFSGFVVLVRDGKEFDLTAKPPAHLAGFAVQSRPRVWKRLHPVEFSGDFSLITRGGYIPAQARTGVDQFPKHVLAHVSRFACSVIGSLLRCMHEAM